MRRRGVQLYAHEASIRELPYKVDVTRIELIADSRKLALAPAIELFRRFGWDPGADVLTEMQSELWKPGRLPQRASV
jgi:hypothetical protein